MDNLNSFESGHIIRDTRALESIAVSLTRITEQLCKRDTAPIPDGDDCRRIRDFHHWIATLDDMDRARLMEDLWNDERWHDTLVEEG